MTIVVGIDPSMTATGLAIYHHPTPPQLHTIKSHGTKTDTHVEQLQRLLQLRNNVMNLIPRNTTLAIIEGPSFGSQGAGQHNRAGYWWMLATALHHLNIPTAICPPSTRAKYACDKGNAGKADVAMGITKLWPHLTIKGDDQADALVFATIAAQHLGLPLPFNVLERHKLALSKMNWPTQPTDTLNSAPTTADQKRMTGTTQ